MQVYRGFDIGTAKPGPELLTRIPHHLIDICDPEEQFNLGRFVEEAQRLISSIDRRERLPVVCGGTGFYFRGLVYGLPETPAADEAVRSRLQRRLREEGLEALYRELGEVDPPSAAQIERGDSYRVLRALEVYETSGTPRSAFPVPTTPRRDLTYRAVGLYRDRELLYRRINERVDEMFEAGLPREVARLLRAGVREQAPAMRAIGYREFLKNASRKEIEGERIPAQRLAAIRDEIALNSRRYAKRQITFFSKLPEVRWIEPGEEELLIEEARALLEVP